jgi:hypothetical protein
VRILSIFILYSMLVFGLAYAGPGVTLRNGQGAEVGTESNPLTVSFGNGSQTIDGSLYVANSLLIDTDGSLYIYGNGTQFEDLRFPANELTAGATPPDVCNVVGSTLRTRCFDGAATTESLELLVQLPHNRKLKSALYPHIHWGPSNTNAGNVKWQLEYSCADINGTFGASGTINVVDASDTVTHKHQIAGLPEIDTSLYGDISSMCLMRIFRNPSDQQDSYGSDAELYEFDIHYEIDALGSRSEYVK